MQKVHAGARRLNAGRALAKYTRYYVTSTMLPVATNKGKTKWRTEWLQQATQREGVSGRDDRHFVSMVERRGSFGTKAK